MKGAVKIPLLSMFLLVFVRIC